MNWRESKDGDFYTLGFVIVRQVRLYDGYGRYGLYRTGNNSEQPRGKLYTLGTLEECKKAATEQNRLFMLRHDGEVWEIAPGEGNDENTVKCRIARPKKNHPESLHDQKAIDAGCTHVQTSYGGDLYHEVRRIR